MECTGLSNLIAVAIGSLVVALGWFATYYANRRHEVAKKRIDYRINMLHSIVELWFIMKKDPNVFSQQENVERLHYASLQVNLYGDQKEVDAFFSFQKALGEFVPEDLDKLNNKIDNLISLVKINIRKEIGLKQLNVNSS